MVMPPRALKLLYEHWLGCVITSCDIALTIEVNNALLSGAENQSFKSIANIEEKLGISCLVMS